LLAEGLGGVWGGISTYQRSTVDGGRMALAMLIRS
jgi:hypothetical protein